MDYLDCIFEKLCGRSSCLVLTLKSPDLTSIFNIRQNFYMSRFIAEENQNSEPIYYRSQNLNPETRTQKPEPRTQNSEPRT